MKKNNVILVMLIAALILAACKKDGGDAQAGKPAVTPVGTTDGAPASQTIGTAGGTIISDDGEMELIIPSGALTTNTSITIQPITNNAPNGRRKAYRCLPDGQQFAKNITVKFHYTEEDAAATKPEYMMVAFQTSEGRWQVVENVTNDETGKTLSAAVNHFTDFTAFDVMRIEPALLYLKTNQTGEYIVSAAGMSRVNDVLLINGLLDKPETWQVNGISDGNIEYGTIAANSDQTKGIYKAPATAPTTNPVIISAEINFPFFVDGQQFNKGILTANAFIIGGRYKVDIEVSGDMAAGTGEIFRMHDHARFTVNLIGLQGTVSDIQNSPVTFQRIANSTNGCNTVIDPYGTGPLNMRDRDVLDVTVNGLGDVVVTFDATVEIVNPKFIKSCPGTAPTTNEIPIWSSAGMVIYFKDNGQVQEYSSQAAGNSVKITISPMQ
jgi:hypothetical protein